MCYFRRRFLHGKSSLSMSYAHFHTLFAVPSITPIPLTALHSPTLLIWTGGPRQSISNATHDLCAHQVTEIHPANREDRGKHGYLGNTAKQRRSMVSPYRTFLTNRPPLCIPVFLCYCVHLTMNLAWPVYATLISYYLLLSYHIILPIPAAYVLR